MTAAIRHAGALAAKATGRCHKLNTIEKKSRAGRLCGRLELWWENRKVWPGLTDQRSGDSPPANTTQHSTTQAPHLSLMKSVSSLEDIWPCFMLWYSTSKPLFFSPCGEVRKKEINHRNHRPIVSDPQRPGFYREGLLQQRPRCLHAVQLHLQQPPVNHAHLSHAHGQ